MENFGRIIGVATDYVTGKLHITLELPLDQIITDECLSLSRTGEIEVKLQKPKKKRSLNANAYFHVLVNKMASKIHTSNARMKNILLARYGCREMENGHRVVLSILSELEELMEERSDIHLNAIGHGFVDNKEFTHYEVIRGSHTYNTEEMSNLIEGTVMEAKEMGIETMTPNELAHMLSIWKARNENDIAD